MTWRASEGKHHRVGNTPTEERPSTIKNLKSIHERSDVINHRIRIGGWEGDTCIGAGFSGVILVMIERRTNFMIAVLLHTKDAENEKRDDSHVESRTGRVKPRLVHGFEASSSR